MEVIVNAERVASPEVFEPINQVRGFYSQLLSSLGYPDDKLPVADLLRQYHNLSGKWVVVSPVHWQATHNDALILACDHLLELNDKEGMSLFKSFTDFVAEDQMETYFCHPTLWLLRIDNMPEISTKPVRMLLNQSMMPTLEKLGEHRVWAQFLTETQMLLSGHFVNTKRVELPINGVWVWGQGGLQEKTNRAVRVNSERLFTLANILSKNVKCYDSFQKLTKKTLLLIDEFDERLNSTDSSLAHNNHQGNNTVTQLEQQFKQKSSNWYWNNMAYRTKPKSRWFRLWSRL